MVAECFRIIGLQCVDTNDDRNETRHGRTRVSWHPPAEFQRIAQNEAMGQMISTDSVAFHPKADYPSVPIFNMGGTMPY